MRQLYNQDSSHINERFSKMVERELKTGKIVGDTIGNMVDSLNNYKIPKIVFLIENSEIHWNDNEIRIEYRQEDDPDNVENAVDRISITEFCTWMLKEKHHIITHEGHNHKGVFDQWEHAYKPEDLLRDPIFDRDYYLELFLSDRGY